MTTQTKPVIGQDAICPDGLGYVIDFCFDFPNNWIQVKTRVNDRSCKWDAQNVTLLALPPVAVAGSSSIDKHFASEPPKEKLEAEVRLNFCNCHPETCGCPDWAVFIGKEKHSVHFKKTIAQLVANAINAGIKP